MFVFFYNSKKLNEFLFYTHANVPNHMIIVNEFKNTTWVREREDGKEIKKSKNM
jgi:hypothetical protein